MKKFLIEKKRQDTRSRSTTSVDVARRAGVSRTAVSYVLNGVHTPHVSEETRVKVLQAASELGYHLNTSAQSLRKGQSNEVCILIDISLSPNDSEIFMSMQQHALRLGYIPVVYFIGGLTSEQQRDILIKILARRPLALLIPDCIGAEDIVLAQQMGIECIMWAATRPGLANAVIAKLPTFSLSTVEIGYLAAQHLLQRGHRSLGIVQPDEARYELAFLQRVKGMCAAIADSGLPDAEVQLTVLPLHLSMSSAHALVDTHLSGPRRPDSIYSFNDEYALPLMGALLDHGLRIPQDIAVIGTDNIAFSAFVRPALTTISIDNSALGRWVVEILVALQKGGPLSEELSHPPALELILRSST